MAGRRRIRKPHLLTIHRYNAGSCPSLRESIALEFPSDRVDNFRQDLLSLPASEQGAFIVAFAEPLVEYARVDRLL